MVRENGTFRSESSGLGADDRAGCVEPDRRAFTDICTLCRDICGVNLSVGYHHEHSGQEYLSIREWRNKLDLSRTWLGSVELPRFPLEPR